ncbi:hypothetical protein ACP70R_042047 [Stipagrostis hirtigluma subsp. patula]
MARSRLPLANHQLIQLLLDKMFLAALYIFAVSSYPLAAGISMKADIDECKEKLFCQGMVVSITIYTVGQ